MHIVPLIILALIIPPLAVFMKTGLKLHLYLNITLYILGPLLFIFQDFPYGAPVAAAHAIWVILQD